MSGHHISHVPTASGLFQFPYSDIILLLSENEIWELIQQIVNVYNAFVEAAGR